MRADLWGNNNGTLRGRGWDGRAPPAPPAGSEYRCPCGSAVAAPLRQPLQGSRESRCGPAVKGPTLRVSGAGDVFSPVVLFPEAKNVADLAVGQRAFPLAHRPGDGRVGRPFAQECLGRLIGGDLVIDGVEHLKP